MCVRQAYYSVPARLSGRKVAVRLGASRLEVLDASRVVARHERSLHKNTETLMLDHYLEILIRKPGALPGATALAQARASGDSARLISASGTLPGVVSATLRAPGP